MRLHPAALGLLLIAGCATGSQTVSPVGHQPTGILVPAGQSGSRTPSTTPDHAVPANTVPAKRTTQRVVIRPVTAAGRPAAGFAVVPGTQGTADCATPIGSPSPVAVERGIVECSPAVLYAVACWPAGTARSVLCYQDPWTRQLTLLHTDGPIATPAAPRTPSALGLQLADGTRCRLRVGGAWPQLAGHPDLFGTYFCSNENAVWGLAQQDGVDRSAPTWTVRVAPMSGRGTLRTVAVRSAYYVGTAATA